MNRCPYCHREITNWRCSKTCGCKKCMKKYNTEYNAQTYRNMPKEKRRIRDREHYLRSLGLKVKKAKMEGVSVKKILQPIQLQRLSGNRFIRAVNEMLKL